MEQPEKLSRYAQKNQRSEQILSAAFGKFCQSGFSDTRIEDIAQQLKLSKGTVYLYFNSKEQLFEAMLEQAVETLHQQLQHYPTTLATSPDSLKAVLDFLFKLLVEDSHNRDLFRLFIAEKSRFPSLIAAQHQSLIQAIIQLLNDCIANQPEFDCAANAHPTPTLSYLLLAPIIGALVYQLISGERSTLSNQQLFSQYLNTLSAGQFIAMSQAP